LVDPPKADFINKSERDRNSELHRADSMESQLAEERLGHFRGCPENLRHRRRVPSLPSSMDWDPKPLLQPTVAAFGIGTLA